MTKFHIEWHKNPSLIPEDPVKNVKLNLSLLESVKADLKSGKLIDWGTYCDAASGYCILEGTETDITPTLLKWVPYIQFDAPKPIINVDQTIEAINKCAAQLKTK
jgi:hypothetical protein